MYDKGGYIYAAGMVLGYNPAAFVIAEHTGNLQGVIDIGGTLYNLRATATEAYRWSSVVTGAGVATSADPQNPQRIPILPISESIVRRVLKKTR